jgi:uncharacterized membrane protein
MNVFETFDRYDFAMCVLMDLVGAGVLILGAPLWAIVPIVMATGIAMFIRHFDETMGP